MAAETARLPVIGQDLSTMTFVMNELVSQVNSEMNRASESEAVKSVINDISAVRCFSMVFWLANFWFEVVRGHVHGGPQDAM